MINDEQIVLELAKLDGWKVHENPKALTTPNGDYRIWSWHEPELYRYLDSYSKIIPLIQKQTLSTRIAMVDNLIGTRRNEGIVTTDLSVESIESIFTATPKQLGMALLKTIGKLEEK